MKPLTDFSLKGLQHGHRQAMSKTFLRLKTRPEEYTPELKKCYFDEVTHCELCGAALTYSFNLIHAEDSDFTKKMSLKVGADCIYNFYEAYMPGSAEQILYTIQEAMADSKVNKFKKDNPDIFIINDEIKKTISEYKSLYGYTFQRLKSVNQYSELSRILIRQQYLSKPKVQYLRDLNNLLKSKIFKEMLVSHQNFKKELIVDYVKQNKLEKKKYEFITTFSLALGMGQIDKTISNLDYTIFQELMDTKKTKISSLWLNQAQTKEGIFLLNQKPLPNYSEINYLISWFHKFQPLTSAQMEIIKKEMNINKTSKILTKPPKVWHNMIKELINKDEI